jgi:cellulose/xylan binding protein with CBM9 domain
MTRYVTAIAVAVLLLPQRVTPAQSAPADPRGYVCYRASSPVSVDGRLDEAAWREAPWTEDFVDIEGDRKPVPAFRTRARMLWDETYFYIGAELVEPHVWATMKEHDSVIFRENDFEFFIDPNGDSHEYYEFEINALGTGWDLLLPRPYKDGGKAVNNWEIAGLKSAVHVEGTLNVAADTDRGWSVELAVPWKALGELARVPSPPADGDQWRVNFSRVEWALETSSGAYRPVAGRREDNWVWSPQGVVDMHRPESWGYVQFSTARPGTATFKSDPSLAGRRWLHQVYYAQRSYRQAHGRWASTLEALQIPAADARLLAAPVIEITGSLFEASIEVRLPGGGAERWHIRQDALIWRE